MRPWLRLRLQTVDRCHSQKEPLPGGQGTRTITLLNACNATVWPVLRDSKLAISSTYELVPGEHRRIFVHNGWAGTVGARTGCRTGGGHCETGECSARTPCYNANVVPYTQARLLLPLCSEPPVRHCALFPEQARSALPRRSFC